MRFLSPINDKNGTRNKQRAEAPLPLLRRVIGLPLGRSADLREHADAFLHSGDETLLYVQNRLRRNEKKAEGAERRAPSAEPLAGRLLIGEWDAQVAQ
jgi:hypothetical protein